MIFCLKGPCCNSNYQGEVFSWHRPKLVEYISDDESYIWVQLCLGSFCKSGFYDWALFNLGDHGKESVNKILDIDVKSKQEKSPLRNYGKHAITVKSVKGRFIVQPSLTRDLSLH